MCVHQVFGTRFPLLTSLINIYNTWDYIKSYRHEKLCVPKNVVTSNTLYHYRCFFLFLAINKAQTIFSLHFFLNIDIFLYCNAVLGM